jgi:hypothetical protein
VPGFLVRAKAADDPQPLPSGPPLKGPPLLETTPEEQYNQGVVTDKVPPGKVLVAPGDVPPGTVLGAPPDLGTPGAPCAECQGGADGCCGDACCCGADAGCDGLCGDGSCCCPCDGGCGDNHLFWLRGEYLLWNLRANHTPPLVSTGPPLSRGHLSEGATSLFGGSINEDVLSGGRFTAGVWLDSDQCWGLEGSFFFLGENSVNFRASSQGIPLLARPFFDTDVGAEMAELVAGTVPPLPPGGPLTGSVAVHLSSELWGAEANGLRNLWCDCMSGPDWLGDMQCRLDLIGGFRFLHLNERLDITEDLLTPVTSPFPGTSILVGDHFITHNDFYGGQLGLRGELHRGPWQLDMTAKVALGDTHQSLDINGTTVIAFPGQPPTSRPGGLLALPYNSGSFTRDRLSVVPEANVNLGYWVTEHWRVFAGFDFLYWNNVARPGEQIATGPGGLAAVSASQVPSLGGSPTAPHFAPVFRDTDFWAYGANIGVEFRY